MIQNIIVGLILATGNISSAGNISGAYFVGNGSQLSGVTASDVAASALTGTTLSSNVIYSSLTTVGTLTSLSVAGNVAAGGVRPHVEREVAVVAHRDEVAERLPIRERNDGGAGGRGRDPREALNDDS